MKKISFKNLDSLGIERLSKADLKNTFGGNNNPCNPSPCPPYHSCQITDINTSAIKCIENTWICVCPDGVRYSVYGKDPMHAAVNAEQMCSTHMSGPYNDIVCQPYQ